MPGAGHRKKAFSAKQKRKQLQDKRERTRDGEGHDWGQGTGGCGRHRKRCQKIDQQEGSDESSSEEGTSKEKIAVNCINHQPAVKNEKGYNPNRYRLHFQHETRAELELRKEQSKQPLQMLSEEAREVDLDSVYMPGSVLDMPKRPPWNYNMSKEQLLAREQKYFKEYLQNVLEKYSSEELSYFELNLETWRQLWRVLEMSDIILLITDIRHPAIHFSPALYNFVTQEMKKPLILVLNKIDLASPALVIAWKHYFQEKFPDVHIVTFTSFPKKDQDKSSLCEDPGKVLHKRRKRGGSHVAVGPKQLLRVCETLVQGKVDLNSWKRKIEEDVSGDDDTDKEAEIHMEDDDGTYQEHVHFKDGILTIGCCGFPNVGKSSLINGLVGKKVVSVSRTPGHTKHFQTIFLTPTVKLCDSPGLVFPSLVHKPLQIIAGLYPIAQVREPYTAVGYLSQRIPVHELLKLKHPDVTVDTTLPTRHAVQNVKWSAYDICEAWAEKRGFFTARAARNDSYRAANHILRMSVNGRLIMCMRPPGYTSKEEYWESHPETEEIAQLHQVHRRATHFSSDEGEGDSSSESADENEGTQELENGARGQDTGRNPTTSKGIDVNNPFALLAEDD